MQTKNSKIANITYGVQQGYIVSSILFIHSTVICKDYLNVLSLGDEILGRDITSRYGFYISKRVKRNNRTQGT